MKAIAVCNRIGKMVTLLQIELAFPPQVLHSQAWFDRGSQVTLLGRACYRTGQLDELDWIMMVINSLESALHPETVRHFYQRVLPRLTPADLAMIYILRFQGQLSDAMSLVTDHRSDHLYFSISLTAIAEGEAKRAEEYEGDNFDPGMAVVRYFERRGSSMEDVTAAVKALPEETEISAIDLTTHTDEPRQPSLLLLTPEEKATLGSTAWPLAKAFAPAETDPLELSTSLAPLNGVIPVITPLKVKAAWKQVLSDNRYLVWAYTSLRTFKIQLWNQHRQWGTPTKVIITLTGEMVSQLQTDFISLLSKQPANTVPVIEAYIRYLQAIIVHFFNGSMGLESSDLDDEDPVLRVVRPETSWKLDLDTMSQAGLNKIMAGYAGEIPTDEVVMQRLLALVA